VLGEHFVPHHDVVERARVGIFRDVREEDGLLDRRDLLLQLRDDFRPVVSLASVAVAVDG
jgi:hypothetical protein